MLFSFYNWLMMTWPSSTAVFDTFEAIAVYMAAYITVIHIYSVMFILLLWIYSDIYLFLKFSHISETWRAMSFLVFMMPILVVLYVWYLFNPEETGFQYMYSISLIDKFNVEFIVGIDGISVCFLLLTVFIMALCCFAAIPLQTNYKEFMACLFLIEIFLILSFMMIDLLFFYVFFESVLMPMFMLIGFWGSRERKIRAAYYFFLYTLFGSLVMLFGILYIYSMTGTTDFQVLMYSKFPVEQQMKLWLCFFLPFAMKVPMLPFHMWLPEAHVEAPTIGSMILASLLLKLGGYGFLRFTLPLFPIANLYYNPLIYSLAVMSVIYASLSTISQIDLKRMIAYSSVAHMNLVVLGLFSYTQQGIDGAMYLMIGHGIVSTALFFCVGVLYDSHHTSLLEYYGGLAQMMPSYVVFLFFFTLANMGFPGTSNFMGELLMLVGLFEKNMPILLLSASGIVFSAMYSIWLYNSICFGALKLQYFSVKSVANFRDITYLEQFILFSLTVPMFLLGMHSNMLTELTKAPVSLLLLGVC